MTANSIAFPCTPPNASTDQQENPFRGGREAQEGRRAYMHSDYAPRPLGILESIGHSYALSLPHSLRREQNLKLSLEGRSLRVELQVAWWVRRKGIGEEEGVPHLQNRSSRVGPLINEMICPLEAEIAPISPAWKQTGFCLRYLRPLKMLCSLRVEEH